MSLTVNNPKTQVVDCGTASIDVGNSTVTVATKTQNSGDILLCTKTNAADYFEYFIGATSAIQFRITQQGVALTKATYNWALLREV